MKKGFTIVELIIYMALLSIFLVVLLDIFTTTLNLKLTSESASGINQDARYILAKLSYDIYNADSVSTPASLGNQTTSLVLVKSGVTYTYQIDGNGDLTLTTGGVSAKLNGNETNIESISFRRLGVLGGTPTLQISYVVRSRIITQGNVLKSQTIDTTLGLR